MPKPGTENQWWDRWRSLSAEERQAKLRELRQKYGFGPAPCEPVPKWREEWDKLSPQQRRARLEQWRQQRIAAPLLTPKDRELYRQQVGERLHQTIATLRQKASNNLTTAEENNRLHRLEELARRFKPHTESGGEAPSLPAAPQPQSLHPKDVP